MWLLSALFASAIAVMWIMAVEFGWMAEPRICRCLASGQVVIGGMHPIDRNSFLHRGLMVIVSTALTCLSGKRKQVITSSVAGSALSHYLALLGSEAAAQHAQIALKGVFGK